MKSKYLIYFFITVILLNISFITSIEVHNFSIDPNMLYMIQDNAGLISAKAKDQIISINNYLKNKNSVNVVILTFDKTVGNNIDKEFFINNYKKEKGIDKNTFIIAIFPKETVINVDESLEPYFSDLLLDGFKRKIKQGKEDGNLDEVLLEITQKVQQKLKQHGWVNIHLYKIKDFFNDFLVRLGLTSDNSIEKDLTYSIKKKMKKKLSVHWINKKKQVFILASFYILEISYSSFASTPP